MWFERFVIIATSLHRDYLPSSWAMFYPTMYDIGDYIFSFGLFFTLFLLFAKFLPVVNMAEVKAILKSSSAAKVVEKKSAGVVSDMQTKPAFNKDADNI
jgi:molybdopterin-containing oxidoreductase family membrane subunit